ncbi:hypothetical protein SEA_MILDRED21_34 [Streptomyces phage Mildred21]|uniref:Uncharacterized protein n=1 Tax=Streptomyces phage Mildred21 TaxID=2023959 RepID=A0A222YTZ5_9CAUD|nr:hypothetical protein FDI35_gp034 [Streptomyces phage Mildred21]ASR75442.1 hypothetical protein SEA_MILDRED21_34 [Streptomyces phage Mildred21]
MNPETAILECMIACGWGVEEAKGVIADLKQEAVEADSAFEIEVSNLRNAVNEAKGELQRVLYNLGNA